MGLHKSKVIKKIKMDMQSQALKKAPTTQLKVSIKKAEKKSDALKKNINSSQKRRFNQIKQKYQQLLIHLINTITRRMMVIVKFIQLLNYKKYQNQLKHQLFKFHQKKLYILKLDLLFMETILKNSKKNILNIMLHFNILYISQLAFSFPKIQIFNRMSQNVYLTGKSFPNLDLILIDYTLYNKIIDKKPSKKIFPFHPSKVPFDYKKHYNIQEYSEYINHLIGSIMILCTD